MTHIILVRHAMPAVEPGVAASLWGLGEAAREDCVLLAHALARQSPAAIWSSHERKARETAEVLGLRLGMPVEVDPAFGEVDRPQVWDRDYREVAAGFLAGSEEPGWEPREAVRRRFATAVERATAGGTDAPVIVVTHGLAMALWTSVAATVGDVVAWWQALSFPDAWVIDTDTRRADRAWMGPPGASYSEIREFRQRL